MAMVNCRHTSFNLRMKSVSLYALLKMLKTLTSREKKKINKIKDDSDYHDLISLFKVYKSWAIKSSVITAHNFTRSSNSLSLVFCVCVFLLEFSLSMNEMRANTTGKLKPIMKWRKRNRSQWLMFERFRFVQCLTEISIRRLFQ